jgi:hypothetical protein
MEAIASRRRGSMVVLLFIALAGCSGQLFAKTCDQPVVSFKAGQLSVSSNGCSLQQTLNAISRQTGMEVEMPASASTIPVFAVLGPGDPARVISELLEGSPFNCTLTAKADGSGGLVRVVLSERVAFVPDKPPAAAGPPAAPAASARTGGAQGATRASSGSAPDPNKDTKKKKEDGPTVASADYDDQSDQPRRRALDEDTLKKMPPLPPGVSTDMWQLYPTLVDNGGVAPSGPRILPNGQPAPPVSAFNSANNEQPLGDPAAVPKGAVGLPTLQPGIDPAIGKLYPWNLMQLIQTHQIQLPNIQLPPMAQPIRNP